MKNNKPKVSTRYIKYRGAREKEDRILNLMREYPGGISPKTIYNITGIPHDTVKSILRRLENKRIIKSLSDKPGYYIPVENPTHSMLFYNAQNIIFQVKSDKIIVDKKLTEKNDLDGMIKFQLEIGSKSKKATFSVSSGYTFNLTSLAGYAHMFQEKMMRLCNFKPELDEINIITYEANHDYIKHRIDGINCYTVRNAIADFKLYNKRNCVREEYKIKAPINFRFVSTLLQQGITTANYSQKIDKIENRLAEQTKSIRNLNELFKRLLNKLTIK